MSKEVILTRGIPASGKTTWAEQHVRKNTNFVNLNRDDLRAMMFGRPYKFSKARETAVSGAQFVAAEDAIKRGRSLIISDTNLSEQTQRLWRLFAEKHDASFWFKNFDCDLDVALERNALRADGVPPHVIHRMYNEYIKQVHPEWIVEPDPSLPPAIIVDVDGTLADHTGRRSPFDWSSVSVDAPHEDVIDLVHRYSHDHTVIIMTGRDGVAESATRTWLHSNGVNYDELYIREAGDTRKDSIIKRELFDKHVRGRYNVRFVVDDRLQVIYMWRALGLKVLDVAGGVF